MTLALVYHEDYLLHEHTPTHPERRERLQYTMDQLREEGVLDSPAVDLVEPRRAAMNDLRRVHTRTYLNRLRRMARRGRGMLSIDTHVSEHVWEQARLAAGGVTDAVEAVAAGRYPTAFVMARPGGHHAFPDDAHGYCYLNNTAIAIKRAQKRSDVDRVLVWDWDAHHGDGTQAIFADDPSVLVLSTHQSGETLFPGTGFVNEVGEGEGEGYTVNVPVPPRTGDDAYLRIVDEIFEPIARQYDPDLLFVEAGQDNHFTDPITDLGVTAQGYAQLMKRAVATAEDCCDGKVVASLAGGYGIEGGLPYTNLAVIAALAGFDTSHIREPEIYAPPDPDHRPDTSDVLEDVRNTHAEYWKL